MKLYTGIKFHIDCYLDEICNGIEPLPEDCIVFTCRSNGIMLPLFAKLLRLSTARYWTGNDAWKYKNIWHYRWRAKIINLLFDKHYFISQGLKDATGLNGIVRTITTPLMREKLLPRIKNRTFTIGYYLALGSFKDRYGIDVICELMTIFPQFNWFAIEPGQYKMNDMQQVYRFLDLYIRPSRWDGDPFMVREALHFGVPTISTFSSDEKNIVCDPDNISELIYLINYKKREYENTNRKN